MVLINKAINEVTVKLVFYGPGLCGKTTNLEKIYGNPKMGNKGKMISMATETDRTLFFDFLPMELGTVNGQKVRVQLYTVPGQVFYDATRKLVLRGADGVVFVADSQTSMRQSNLDSLQNLKTNLRLNRIDPDKVALVFQYNKRDLPSADSVEEMSSYLEPGSAPVVEAVAVAGQGVTNTLRAAISGILDNLQNQRDISLEDAPELMAPDMSVRSGATPASAGTAKLSLKPEDRAAAVSPSPDRVGQSNPAPVPSPFQDSPFGVDDDTVTFSPEASAEVDPFDTTQPVGEFDGTMDGRTVVQENRGDLRLLMERARDVVRSLEAALEAARANERALAERLGEQDGR
jgi:signal recognition particle receptor subunit beta